MLHDQTIFAEAQALAQADEGLTVVIPGRARADVASLAEASAFYATVRDESGEGGSTFPCGIVRRGAQTVGHLSYNACIWAKPSRDWNPGDAPLFDPSRA